MTTPVEIRLLGPGDAATLDRVAEDVFDGPIEPMWCAEFFADPRHHIVVAVDDGCVVGMATGVHYVHPDKPPELWVNEVGVASTHRGQGIAGRMLDALFAHARTLGCIEAWLGTEEKNTAARKMYVRAGGFETPMIMCTFEISGDSLE